MSDEKKGPKPGYKSTEFWITVILTLAGLIMSAGFSEDSPVVKVAGMVLSLGAALGYTIVRGGVKKAANGAKMLFVVMLPFLILGCCKGHIPVSEIEDPVKEVVEQQHRFLNGEATAGDKNPDRKATHLRTGTLLIKQLKVAKGD